MTDLRHPDDDLLLDLALSDVDEQRRDGLTGHLAVCEPCRTRYAGIADGVDHVLAAAPRVAPPPGFSTAVLAAMGVRSAHAHARVRVAPAPRRRSTLTWVAAVAAVIGLLAGVLGGAVVLRRSGDTAAVSVAAVGPALVTGDGSRVGTVLDSTYDGHPVLVVTVTRGRVGVRYDCQLVLADGSRRSGGSWALADESGTWVLARPDADVRRVELVTETGGTWATATLAPAGGY